MTLLPVWLTPLPDASEQRAIDAWAIEECGIPSLELMENAGGALAELVEARVPDGRVAIVCGKGNNGGDGLVAARWLRGRGREVDVLLLAPGEELTGDPRANLDRLTGEPSRLFTSEALTGVAVIIDAIFGTGFSGEPRDRAAGAIAAINRAAERPRPPLVIACDVPSGVDASTGEAAQSAVRAQLTITFSAAKPGLWIAPGKAHAGEVTVADISIPSGAPVEPGIGLIDSQVVDQIPRRRANSTKFAAGAVLVCGGSTGLTGATSLACEAAQRAGAGYVTALVPRSLGLVFEQRLLEAMSLPLPDEDGALTVKALEPVLERTERADALVLGPGIGRAPATQKLVRRIARRAELPLLLDADGLNAIAGRLDAIAERPAATVLTPHAGELGRLLERSSAEIDARRLACAREAAERSRAVIVLKGDDTLVAEPEGRVAVSRGGASALATAGTGDVLSGVIGAYLSKGMDPFEAACAGVFVHARAGVLAAEALATEGVIARDVIELLPHARASALRS
jgi:NAD(P)H-hydrate epimerase